MRERRAASSLLNSRGVSKTFDRNGSAQTITSSSARRPASQRAMCGLLYSWTSSEVSTTLFVSHDSFHYVIRRDALLPLHSGVEKNAIPRLQRLQCPSALIDIAVREFFKSGSLWSGRSTYGIRRFMTLFPQRAAVTEGHGISAIPIALLCRYRSKSCRMDAMTDSKLLRHSQKPSVSMVPSTPIAKRISLWLVLSGSIQVTTL